MSQTRPPPDDPYRVPANLISNGARAQTADIRVVLWSDETKLSKGATVMEISDLVQEITPPEITPPEITSPEITPPDFTPLKVSPVAALQSKVMVVATEAVAAWLTENARGEWTIVDEPGTAHAYTFRFTDLTDAVTFRLFWT